MAGEDGEQQEATADASELMGSEPGEQPQAAPVMPDEAALTWDPAAAGAACTQMLPETPIELWNFDSEPAAPIALLFTQGMALVTASPQLLSKFVR